MGSIAKAAVFLIGWSMLLIGLMETRVEQMQKEHRRDLEELKASTQGLRHQVSGQMVQSPSSDKVALMREVAATAERDRLEPAPAPAPPAQEVLAEAPRPGASAATWESEPQPAPPVLLASAEAADEQPAMRLRSKSARERKLMGFYQAGTTAQGVTCLTFNGATTQANMNSDSCRGSANTICAGCFIALDDGNDKTLQIVKCSSAKYKVGSTISSHVVEIQIMNSDPDNALTVQACADVTCTVPVSTFTMSYGDSTVGFCYTGGSDKIYFPTTVFQNQASYNFAGKTIIDLGTVQTAIIQAGTISGTDITVGSSKTLDVSSGTLTLADGQIPATKITGGTFTTSQAYSFVGSTISDTGTIQNCNIDGGTITGTSITVGSTKFLDVSGGTLTLAAGQITADRITAGQFKTSQSYSFAGSTVTDLGVINTADINGGTIDGVTINDVSITIGSGNTFDASTASSVLFANGQINVGALGTGTFGTGTYSFAGSTISDLGQVTTANIDGGTIDGTNIGATTASTGKFTDVLATGVWKINIGLIAIATGTSNSQAGIVWSSPSAFLAGSTTESLSITNSYAGQYRPIIGTIGPCTGGDVTLLNIAPATGSLQAKISNTAITACTDPYTFMYLIPYHHS